MGVRRLLPFLPLKNLLPMTLPTNCSTIYRDTVGQGKTRKPYFQGNRQCGTVRDTRWAVSGSTNKISELAFPTICLTELGVASRVAVACRRPRPPLQPPALDELNAVGLMAVPLRPRPPRVVERLRTRPRGGGPRPGLSFAGAGGNRRAAGGHSLVVPVRLRCGGRRRRLSLGTGLLGVLTAC